MRIPKGLTDETSDIEADRSDENKRERSDHFQHAMNDLVIERHFFLFHMYFYMRILHFFRRRNPYEPERFCQNNPYARN